MSDAGEAFRAELEEALPKSISKASFDKITEAFNRHAPDLGAELGVAALVIDGARIPVESVEIYGLNIKIDANGRAALVYAADPVELLSVRYWSEG